MKTKFKILLLVIALLSLISGFYFSSSLNLSPAAIFYPTDYIQVSYDPVVLSKTEIRGDEIFYSHFSGKIVWIKNFSFLTLLSLLIKEVKVTYAIVGENQITGEQVILNPAYSVTIKPFPSKKGEIYHIKKTAPLQFPKTTESGDYTLIANLVVAEANLFLFGWDNVSEFVPQSENLGSIKYLVNR